MKRHLFLTGPIGCGKSTAIQNALGERILECSGFLTRRYREPYLHFTMESPDGNVKETFLDFPAGKPILNLKVFAKAGTQLLIPAETATAFYEPDCNSRVYILDEIGGIELLNPAFSSALETILSSDIPILGVVKGEGPASALIDKLGLTEEYRCAADSLRQQLCGDSHTMVYECAQYDKNALLLAKQWAEEYLHE